ncbi:DUF4037 domain-containing protein [Pseudomonas fluorescens]|uniref:DUF4037 domain-containing protein n=1 Tax=Pseudomonas fluorescens TaxID=294 RepID=UPI00399033D2
MYASESGEFQRIRQQVADNLPHACRVAQHQRRKRGFDQAGQFDAGRGILRKQVGGVLDQRAKVERDVLEL